MPLNKENIACLAQKAVAEKKEFEFVLYTLNLPTEQANELLYALAVENETIAPPKPAKKKKDDEVEPTT